MVRKATIPVSSATLTTSAACVTSWSMMTSSTWPTVSSKATLIHAPALPTECTDDDDGDLAPNAHARLLLLNYIPTSIFTYDDSLINVPLRSLMNF